MKALFAICFAFLFTFASFGSPVLYTFDNGLPAGLQWNNMWYADGTLYPASSGFVNGVVSPNTVPYTFNGMQASISRAQPFDFLSR